MPYQRALAPLLPLEFFREIIGWDPWRFWGWNNNGVIRTQSSCDPVIMEYDWQRTDAPGRSDIAEAIVTAETRLCDYLGYEVAPRFKYDTLQWPTISDNRMVRYGGAGANGQWLSMQLRDGFIQAVGAETLNLIQLGAGVAFTDPDGDTLNELAVIGPIPLPAGITDISQIALYVPSMYRYGLDNTIGEQWRIQPTFATISGGYVTIRAFGYNFMKPELKEGYADDMTVDPLDPTNFMNTIDVYQRTVSTGVAAVPVDNSAGVVYWQTTPYHCSWCQCQGCGGPNFNGAVGDPAAIAQASARVGIQNARTGYITPAESLYDTSTGQWTGVSWGSCSQPDSVLVRYLAGQPLGQNGFMDRKWRNIVARFAAAELKRNIVGCEEANRFLYYWQQDMAKIGNASTDLFSVTPRVTDNPFGTRRGHVYAWTMVMDLKLITSSVVM